MELLVRPMGRSFPVDAGANLLESLLAWDVPISWSCKDGRCGMCACKVVLGKVIESGRRAREVPGATPGRILACQCQVAEDCGIEVPEPVEAITHIARTGPARVVSIERISPEVRRVRLEATRELVFSPGQHVEISFERKLVRPYSMSGLGPTDFSFDIRLYPGGRASQYIEQTLKVGDSLRLRGPLGNAYLRHNPEDPTLCVAAGTGLAPTLSLLRGMAAAGHRHPVKVLAGFSRASEVYGLDELDEILRQLPHARLNVVIASGPLARGQQRGLLTDAIRAELPDPLGWRAYAFGSPHAIEAVVRLLRQKGLTSDRLYADPFYPAGT